ncbi:GNAT family N-acetyltransferase [Chloroflexota bacterium]
MTRCAFCGAKSHYRDRHSGEYLCLEHARLEVVAAHPPGSGPPLTIRRAQASDRGRIGELTNYFWDETTVDCFDRRYDVLDCPAFLACDGDAVVGQVSYAIETDLGAMVLVGFILLPDYQGGGTGRALLDAARDEALRRGLRRISLVTCNDNLPALAFYQRYGFCLTGMDPGRVARDHAGDLIGLAGIPVRDEIRLAFEVGD